MMKILKMLLFSFLIGVILTITSILWWHNWWHPPSIPPLTNSDSNTGGGVFFLPMGGCFGHGGPWPFLGTCIENKILNFGLDVVFWSAVVFGFWVLINFLKKK